MTARRTCRRKKESGAPAQNERGPAGCPPDLSVRPLHERRGANLLPGRLGAWSAVRTRTSPAAPAPTSRARKRASAASAWPTTAAGASFRAASSRRRPSAPTTGPCRRSSATTGAGNRPPDGLRIHPSGRTEHGGDRHARAPLPHLLRPPSRGALLLLRAVPKDALRRERKTKGLCMDCGRPAPGRALCPECLARRRPAVESRRAALREGGLCRECGRPAAPGHARCPECLEKVNAGTRTLREARRTQGMCALCGGGPACRTGLCEDCYRRVLERNLRRRDRRREEGLCLLCGDPVEPRAGGSVPPYCRRHERAQYGRYRRRYWDRRSRGLCVDCGAPVERGEDAKPRFARCPECRARKREGKVRRKAGGPLLRRPRGRTAPP